MDGGAESRFGRVFSGHRLEGLIPSGHGADVTAWARDVYARAIERGLDHVPGHVAIIQDGNRRYARERGVDTDSGHTAGAETARNVLQWGRDLGITETTLYAFSTENFERPPEERAALFDLIAEELRALADDDRIHADGVKVRAIGHTDRLPERVQAAIETVESATDRYDQYVLNVALAYGGREILRSAAERIAEEAASGALDPETIDRETVAERLYDCSFRDVDLLIRSGGECRTSNFLPWHAVGAEAPFVVVDSYWPAFSRLDLLRALTAYDTYRATQQGRQEEKRLSLPSRSRQLSRIARSAMYSFRR